MSLNQIKRSITVKFLRSKLILLISFSVVSESLAVEKSFSPDFSEGVRLELGADRSNIYNLSGDEFSGAVKRGKLHAMSYPVDVTGLTLPYKFVEDAIEGNLSGVGGIILNPILRIFSPWSSMNDLFKWIGLTKISSHGQNDLPFDSPYSIPDRALLASDYLGATTLDIGGSKALTFSCAACHVGSLFGKPVVGLTNKRPRAFNFINMGIKIRAALNPKIIGNIAQLSDAEKKLLKNTYDSVQFIAAKKPLNDSLDASLAIVGLSLSKRSQDDVASRNKRNARRPRPNPLNHHAVDSKPMVWWNLKYKNRWLSDGSVVSGNPIFTNILWNEIGRGTDLIELESWFEKNRQSVKDLTAMVFSSQPPKYLDFYDQLDLNMAEQGRKAFERHCARCHGSYQKKWEEVPKNDWGKYNLKELAKTLIFNYHKSTPVIDVGTDANRYQGIKYFADDLNRLRLSKKFRTTVKPQRGYVPPPLVGIWARWPYLHNNSVPSLCDLLKPTDKRPKIYYSIPAEDRFSDFDSECVGYPKGDEITSRDDASMFDTSIPGLSNEGHDEGIFLIEGEEILSHADKRALIEYLKTL